MQRYIFLLTYRPVAVFETTVGIGFKNLPGLPMGLWEKGTRQGGQGNWEGGERRREGRGREGSYKFVPPPTYENVPTRLFYHNMIHV